MMHAMSYTPMHYQSPTTSLYLTASKNDRYEKSDYKASQSLLYYPQVTCNDADALMGRSAWTRKVRHREQAPEGRSAGR